MCHNRGCLRWISAFWGRWFLSTCLGNPANMVRFQLHRPPLFLKGACEISQNWQQLAYQLEGFHPAFKVKDSVHSRRSCFDLSFLIDLTAAPSNVANAILFISKQPIPICLSSPFLMIVWPLATPRPGSSESNSTSWFAYSRSLYCERDEFIAVDQFHPVIELNTPLLVLPRRNQRRRPARARKIQWHATALRRGRITTSRPPSSLFRSTPPTQFSTRPVT